MLNPDFKDILSCLRGEGVEFIVVGAYALAAHGLPRATGDIDIWVRNSPENARKVMRALAKFGAPALDFSEEDFKAPDTVLQLGVEPSRIDLLTGIDGVEFDEAWENKVGVNVDGLEIYVLSRADLLKNKLAVGDRKSTRLNSSHSQISYAAFCLKKKKRRLHPSAPSDPALPGPPCGLRPPGLLRRLRPRSLLWPVRCCAPTAAARRESRTAIRRR